MMRLGAALVAAILLAPFPVFGGRDVWTPLSPIPAPVPNSITAIAVSPENPDVVIVAAGDSVFRSPDAGSSWEETALGCFARDVKFDTRTVSGIAPVFAACGGFASTISFPAVGVLFRSDDLGSTWTPVRQTSGVAITHLGFTERDLLAVDQDFIDLHPPVFSANLAWSNGPPGEWLEFPIGGVYVDDLGVAASDAVLASWYSYQPLPVPPVHGGVLRSEDEGRSWVAASGLPDAGVGPLAIDPGDVSHVLAVVDANRIAVSHDGGASWTDLSTVPAASVNALVFDASTANLVWAATSDAGVLVSRDAGVTWSTAGEGLTDRNVTSLASVPGRVYAGTGAGLVFRYDAVRVLGVEPAGASTVRRG